MIMIMKVKVLVFKYKSINVTEQCIKWRMKWWMTVKYRELIICLKSSKCPLTRNLQDLKK